MRPKELGRSSSEVEQFAMHDYALALSAGAALPDAERRAIVAKLHRYTGLPEDYIEKANLRVNGGEFRKTLQADSDLTTGRLDTRFNGTDARPAGQDRGLRPAVGGAALGLRIRVQRLRAQGPALRGGQDVQAVGRAVPDVGQRAPAAGLQFPAAHATNVMPDLANAMKNNPNLKVMLNAGYYDLATPYFQGHLRDAAPADGGCGILE